MPMRFIRGARLTIVMLLLLQSRAPLLAQGSAAGLEIGDVTVSGSLRTRVELWNWFGDSPDGEYAYPGSLFRLALGQSKKPFDWQLEFAAPFLIGLPDRAVGPGPQGPLGFGANYFLANDASRNPAALFVKQAFVRFKNLGGVAGQSLRVGRFEFVDGTEVAPKNVTLASLKRDRITHRVLGNFAFSHVGRSFDGGHYAIDRPRINVTIVGARATAGVFQVNGWPELKVSILYGALTGQSGRAANAAEWRVFALGYRDHRHDVLKTDNRPVAIRREDVGTISIGSFGGHYLRAIGTRFGTVDLLAWGVAQTGSWGALSHHAGAYAAEAGWQPSILGGLAPWIRGGVDYGSGDRDPNDASHGTFFQALPTPRVYARFPFFNMMNARDVLGELVIRPSRAVTARVDAHSLHLDDAHDLWYQGGGAFQPETFGYTGRPSNGHDSLAGLYDASADIAVTPHVSVAAYYGYARSQLVPRVVYASEAGAQLGYAEVLLRF